jgi:hypothetical protein
MKSHIFNRKSLLFATFLASAIGVNAQIKSTHTDEKYAYTTVVYKDKAATDAEVLKALDSSIGMGDVVRVAIAPPKPAATPSIDASKGEDVWLKPSAAPKVTLTASASAVPADLVAKTPEVKNDMTIASLEVKQENTAAAPIVEQTQNKTTETAAPVAKTTKTKTVTKSSKSVKKVAKKQGKKYSKGSKKKYRKAGKQRYSCPKF